MSIRRLFVANRGEIAVRVLRTCAELGVDTVLGVSLADRDSTAAELAGRTVVIGPAHPTRSYLHVPTIVEAAIGSHCDALHPGYGFLSENSTLAHELAERGVVFVGPPADVIALAGDKLAARSVAVDAGLPVVPGGEVETLAEALAFTQQHGYPVLVKAAGGGGGRGIKLAGDAGELAEMFALARAEAGAAFGDERLYVERYVTHARHVEVQIAADDHGGLLHLGERDCSTQRRYQKVIEESPAPLLSDQRRQALHAAALEFARAIGYRNIGTVEFIVDVDSGAFFFLEMNCRIQVEHPVTEAVCGIDLVALQLRIASGEPLGLAQRDVRLDGHAIECRLVAENPDDDFRPSPGTIERFCVPELAGLRVDTHCRAGTVISPYYDSLMAKLISHASERDGALATMTEAIDRLDVAGVHTNRMLLARLVADPHFKSAEITTSWLEELLA
jgi:acetyl-CoA carboxylase biotin carboxylase subunit